MLNGSVQFSESLPPLDSPYKAGATFKKTTLQNLEAYDFWYRIPAWMAGTWRKETSTTYYRQDLKTNLKEFDIDTHMAISKGEYGAQKDITGIIWDCIRLPALSLVETERYYIITVIKELVPLRTSGKSITLLFRGRSFLVNKYSHVIVMAQQQESIQNYSPQGNLIKKCDSTIKGFDENGHPESLTKTMSLHLRTKNFTPWDRDGKQDLQISFKLFLEAHGLDHLVPPRH